MHIEIPNVCFNKMYEIWENKLESIRQDTVDKINKLNTTIQTKQKKHQDTTKEQKELKNNQAILNKINLIPDGKKDYLQFQLEQERCYKKRSYNYIYDILADYGAKKLLRASLEDMASLIKHELTDWNLWAKFNPLGCGKKNKKGEIYSSCGDCKKHKQCKQYQIIKNIKKIFCYDEWANGKMSFTPYDFIQFLNIKACPYCNLEYVQIATFKKNNVQDSEDKYVHPALDHFYPKSKYPFFALSLYNLVPSCTTCNSYIKGDNEISSYENCIHPYDKKINYHENIRYKVCMNSLGAIKRTITNDKGETKEICNLKGEWELMDCVPPEGEKVSGGYKRAQENYKFFAIKERLEQGFSDYISEIYQKTNEYPKEYIKDLKDKGYSAIEAFRLFLANYIDPEDFNLRPLSKITHDLMEYFCPEILDELKKNNYQ